MTGVRFIGRAVRPFSTRRLGVALARVHEASSDLAHASAEQLGSEAFEVVDWCQRLQAVRGAAEHLRDACDELIRACDESFDSAPEDHRLATRAALALQRVSEGAA